MLLSPLKLSPVYGNRGSVFSIANSFYLDGVDEYFSADSLVANVSSDTVGTMSAMVKSVDIIPSSSARILSFADTDANTRINITQDATTGTLTGSILLSGTIQFIVRTTNAIDLTSWTKIDFVQNGTQPVIYINGVAVAQSNIVSTDLTIWLNGLSGIDNFTIGSSKFNSTIEYNYNGYISQVSYLNTNLSQAQITNWYNNGKPKSAQQLFGSNCKFFFNPTNRTGDTAQFSVVDSVNSITATSVNMEDADLSPLTPYVDSLQTIVDKYGTLNAWSFTNIGINGTTTTAYDYEGTHDLSNPAVANQPTFIGGDANINNYPSGYFVTDDYLYKAQADYLSGQSTGAIHCAFTTNANITSSNWVFSSCDEASTNYIIGLAVVLSKFRLLIRSTTGQDYDVYLSTEPQVNTSYVISIYQNGTNIQALVNGVAQTFTDNGSSGTTPEQMWFSDVANRDNIAIGGAIISSPQYSDLDIAFIQITSDSSDATVLSNHNEIKTLYGI